MPERKMKTKIELDGEKEYSASLKSINSGVKLTSSGLSKLKSDYDGQLNSLDYLDRKQKALGKSYELASQKIETMRAALKNAEKIQSEYGEKVDATKAAIAALENEMSKLDTSTDAGAAAYQDMARQLQDLNEELQQNERIYAAAGDSVQDWTTKLNSAYVSKKRLGQQIETTKHQLEEAQASTDKCATSIDGYGKKVKQAASKAEELGDEVKEAGDSMESTGAVTIAMGNIIADVLESAGQKALEFASDIKAAGIEYQQSQAKMSAATGSTGEDLERLNSVARSVFADGLGDSLSEAYDGVIAVKNATGLMDQELQQATKSGFALQETFGFELQESARTAQSLMKNFSISAEEAYNIIAVGAQNGANKNGDLLDILNEYGAQYAALGLDADQFIQSLISGADAGVFSIDKVGDAVKEFNIRAKDGSTTSREAFELLGLSADEMTAKFAAGGNSAKTAMFEVVGALQTMEDPVKKNAAAVGLFGTMYEDLEANLLPILASMEDASGAAYDAMGQINEIQYNDFQSQWERIKRQVVVGTLPQLQTALDKVGNTLEDPRVTESVEEIGDSFGELIESGGELASDVLPLAADGLAFFADHADEIIDILPELTAGVVAYKGATLAADITQKGLNATLGLNPYAAVAAVVIGLGTALAGAVIEANSMDETTKDLNESLRVTQERAQAERSEIEANETAALNLVNQIEALAAKENKSAEEKQRLAGLVTSLNQLVPELGASYDDLSDSLNMSTSEMRNFILQSAKLQAVENMQGELSDLYVEQAKALQNYTEKKNAAIQAERSYNRELTDLNKQLEEGLIDQQMYDSALSVSKTEMELAAKAAGDAEAAYNGISDAVTTAEGDLLDYADATSESEAATEEDTEAKTQNEESTYAAAEAAEEYTEAVNEMAGILGDAGIAVEGLAEKLVQQGLTASDVESKIESYKDTTCDAFQKIEEEQELSVQSMIETLEHNAQVTQAWSENLAILYAAAGDSSTRSFLAYMESLGPSYAPILAELTADTSGELLTSLVSAWSAGSSAAVEAALIAMGVLPSEAAAIAANAAQLSGEQFSADVSAYAAAGEDAQAAYIDALSNITPEASSVLKSLNREIEQRLLDIRQDMSRDGKSAGTNLTSTMKQGITAGKPAVDSAASAVAQSAYTQIKNINWHSAGGSVSQGIAKGILDYGYLVTNAAVYVMANARTAAKNKEEIRSPSKRWGREVGKQLPAGVAEDVVANTPVLLEAVNYSMDRALEAARKTLSEAQGVSLYDFIPSIDNLSRTEIHNYTNNYAAPAASGGVVTGNSGVLESYLPQILNELRGTGGVTPTMIARAMSPYLDSELGTTLRRKERGN